LGALRYESCIDKEVFLIQLLRAQMQKNVKIVLEQPFSLLSHELNIGFIIQTLDALHIDYQDILILDLIHQEAQYKEKRCHIEK